MANLIMAGIVFEGIGTILLAMLVLMVHHRLKKEHRIDKKVIQQIAREEILGVVSIACIAVGFALQLMAF